MSLVVPPSIAITLAINPPNFRMNDPVELSVTVISNASSPITVFTWPSILNPKLRQRQGDLVGFDQDTLEPLLLHTIDMSRLAYNHTLGSGDDKYHVTLEPGQPWTIKTPFAIARKFTSPLLQGLPMPLPGHRYLVDLAPDERLIWWAMGRKEDVMCLPGCNERSCEGDGKSIPLSLDKPVEFKILPLDD